MRIARLLLLGVACFLITLVVMFPAAPLVDRVRDRLGPVALDGVSGPLWRGRVERVRSTDELLPLEFSDVTWRLAPGSLPGGGGAKVGFAGYGGTGAGLVERTWRNDLHVSDFTMTAQAGELEPLLPAPIAEFDGTLSVDIERLSIEDELLQSFLGSIRWSEAVLVRPFAARFGTVDITLAPEGEALHAGTLAIGGGDVDGSGTFTIAPNGDYSVDVALTPSASAPGAIVDGLGRMARPDAAGAYRLQQSGNVNRLM